LSTAAAPTSEVEAALDAKYAIAANQKAQDLVASVTLVHLRAADKAAAPGPERKQAPGTLQAEFEAGVIKAALDSARNAYRRALVDLPNEAPVAARTDAQIALATARVTLRAFCRSKPGKVEGHSY
jgi:hypothetical protein